MNDQLFADAFKIEADFIAGVDNVFAALHRYTGLTNAIAQTPCVKFAVATVRTFGGGRGAIMSLSATVESEAAGDDDAAPPNNHRARVALVLEKFATGKADRIASINGRGIVAINDYGMLSSPSEVVQDTAGARFKTTLKFTLCGRRV